MVYRGSDQDYTPFCRSDRPFGLENLRACSMAESSKNAEDYPKRNVKMTNPSFSILQRPERPYIHIKSASSACVRFSHSLGKSLGLSLQQDIFGDFPVVVQSPLLGP